MKVTSQEFLMDAPILWALQLMVEPEIAIEDARTA